MQIDDKLLARLEKLSMLKIQEDKREQIKEQLSELVSFVDNLSELQTDKVDAKFAMSNAATLARADEPQCDVYINKSILKNAPQSEDGFFIVPKIIE